jgi:hypothetical protein
MQWKPSWHIRCMQFARRVKVLAPESPYFSVTSGGSKVAAGMEAAYTITFTPDSEADFSWDLIVCTEREKFVVPIRARGARGALDFPASVDFGRECACKVAHKRSFVVRNTGRRGTRFALSAAAPFAVAPRDAHLAVGESLQCTVTFTPQRAARAQGDVRVDFDSGDCTLVRATGTGVDIDVAVVPQAVTFLDTFVTKTSQRTFTLVNRTATPAPFALKRFASADEEAAAARAEASTMLLQASPHAAAAPLKGLMLRGTAEMGTGWDSGVDAEEAAAQQRRYTRLLTQTMAHNYLFESGAVAVFPLEGVVYPHSSVEVRLLRRCLLLVVAVLICYVYNFAFRCVIGLGVALRTVLVYDVHAVPMFILRIVATTDVYARSRMRAVHAPVRARLCEALCRDHLRRRCGPRGAHRPRRVRHWARPTRDLFLRRARRWQLVHTHAAPL